MPSSYYWDAPTALCTIGMLCTVFLITMPPIPVGRKNHKVSTKLDSNMNSADSAKSLEIKESIIDGV